jgi:hypothetical protein
LILDWILKRIPTTPRHSILKGSADWSAGSPRLSSAHAQPHTQCFTTGNMKARNSPD